jgi:tRNA dimethylallyltransferase
LENAPLEALTAHPMPHQDDLARDPLLVALVGATGSGKTALSLAIAGRFDGEIVNCDSVALYREFEIGTAKPGRDDRERVPHHLIDVLAPNEVSTAGDYARRARSALKEIAQRGKLPIVVGGTGLYLRALLEGLFSGPARSDHLRERLRERVAQKSAEYLHRVLRRLDPEAAARIHANDTAKVIRAIEVRLAAREKMSELWQRGRDPLTGFRVLRIGLEPERDQLYGRINERAKKMFETGLIEETKALHEKYGDAAIPLQSLGYKQAMQHIRGEIDRKLALWAAQQAHRNYAKRQLTWFRREPGVHWFAGFGDDPEAQRKAIDLVGKQLRA